MMTSSASRSTRPAAPPSPNPRCASTCSKRSTSSTRRCTQPGSATAAARWSNRLGSSRKAPRCPRSCSPKTSNPSRPRTPSGSVSSTRGELSARLTNVTGSSRCFLPAQEQRPVTSLLPDIRTSDLRQPPRDIDITKIVRRPHTGSPPTRDRPSSSPIGPTGQSGTSGLVERRNAAATARPTRQERRERMIVAGVDVGGTNIEAGLVDQDNDVIARAKRNTPTGGPDAVIATIVDLVGSLSEPPVAVGVGIPGVVHEGKRADGSEPVELDQPGGPGRRNWKRCSDVPVALGNDVNVGLARRMDRRRGPRRRQRPGRLDGNRDRRCAGPRRPTIQRITRGSRRDRPCRGATRRARCAAVLAADASRPTQAVDR